MSVQVPDEVRWIVRTYLHTIEHIDLALFLAKQPDVPQPVDTLSRNIAIRGDLMVARLDDLVRTRLVERVPDPAHPAARHAYRLATLDPRLKNALEALQDTYTVRPVSLIRYVYERPADQIQQFADAFRLRRPKP